MVIRTLLSLVLFLIILPVRFIVKTHWYEYPWDLLKLNPEMSGTVNHSDIVLGGGLIHRRQAGTVKYLLNTEFL